MVISRGLEVLPAEVPGLAHLSPAFHNAVRCIASDEFLMV